MKNKIFLLLIIQTLFSVETMFAQITFQKTIGGGNHDEGNSVQQTTDGGYIIAGSKSSSGGTNDVYLIKTNSNGNTLWTKTFGGTGSDAGYSVQQTTDGGYIIAGGIESFSPPHMDVYLIKTDANGDTLWTKRFGENNDDLGNSVKQTTDGGYIITGWSKSFGSGYYEVYLIKTDVNGNLLWSKIYGGFTIDIGSSVQQTADGGYIIAGYTRSFVQAYFDVYLIKTDANGNALWTKTFGGTVVEKGYSVQQTTDGGYIIAGETWSFGAGGADVYLLRTDANGNSLWAKSFGGANDDYGYSVQQTADGGYIVTGYTNSFGAGDNDVYLIRTDANGDSLWTKTFGGTNDDWGYTVQQTADGGYIITGLTYSFGAVTGNVYLIKTDSSGNSGCNEGNPVTIVTTPATIGLNAATIVTSAATVVTTPATIVGSGGTVTTLCITTGVPPIFNLQSSIFNISPNPFSNEINISSTANDLSEIILYDITSRKLLQQTFTGSASINTSQLSKGIYLYEVRNNPDSYRDGIIKKGKVVKE
ncbi:MAG TPA: T9SS type A sorting domain-containing protein [Bacteroidia bacterium]|nr:T9SS type A sorting domain-containing protein [Bacteroidia bacterium]